MRDKPEARLFCELALALAHVDDAIAIRDEEKIANMLDLDLLREEIRALKSRVEILRRPR